MEHGLPHHLIIDILAKLSVQSLLRFKSVCKQWFSSITDPDFAQQHLSNQLKKGPQFLAASAGCFDNNNERRFRMDNISIDIMVPNKNVLGARRLVTVDHSFKKIFDLPENWHDMLHSCDGILCFSGYFGIHVFNPSTREYRTLPQGSLHFHPRCYSYPVHRHPSQRLGIGRDLVTKQYKIVKMLNPDFDIRHPEFCEIFTLDRNPQASWKNIGVVPYKFAIASVSVYVNGAIYWITDDVFHHNKSEVIVKFDMHVENFQAIPHPECCSNPTKPHSMQLGSLRGCLCLAEQESDTQLNMWIMTDIVYSWEKLYCLNLSIFDLRFGFGFAFLPDRIAFAENEEGNLLVCDEDEVYLYNQNSKNLTSLQHRYGRWTPITFTESLIPLYG